MSENLNGTHNVRQDRFDRRVFDDLREASGELYATTHQGGQTWAPLVEDLFATYYKAEPQLAESGDVKAPYRVNRQLVEKTLEDPATNTTRLTTMLDETASALATVAAGQRLWSEVQNRPDLKEAMEKAEQAANLQDKANTARRQAMERAQEGAQALPGKLEGFAQTCEQQAGEIMAEAEKLLQGAAKDVRQAIRLAQGAGQDKADKLVTILNGWGLEPGDLKQVQNLGERLNLAKKLMTPYHMEKLAEFIGRMRSLARAKQRHKLDHARDEVHSVETGSDLDRVLPDELAALRHPLLKLDFDRKMVEDGLMQYELTGKEKAGRGPIVALIDRSGSMKDLAGGQSREDWAIGVALALADTATRQKRACCIAFFDAVAHPEVTFDFKPGEKSPAKLAAIASVAPYGGTDYQPALALALERIKGQTYKKADIMLVSDGCCDLPDDFLQDFNATKKRMDFGTYAVLIGTSDYYGTLRKWADRVWTVATGTDEVAGDILEGVY